jgi:hypothetical protein
MMQVRCQRCGWTFTLSRDAIGLAVAEAESTGADYYQENCPKCRHVVKIQVKELRRRLPPDYVLPPLPPKPEPIHVKKDGEVKPAEAVAVAAPQAEPPAAETKPAKAAKPKAEATPKPKAAPKPKVAAKTKTAAQPKTAAKPRPAAKRASAKK